MRMETRLIPSLVLGQAMLWRSCETISIVSQTFRPHPVPRINDSNKSNIKTAMNNHNCFEMKWNLFAEA